MRSRYGGPSLGSNVNAYLYFEAHDCNRYELLGKWQAHQYSFSAGESHQFANGRST
jgi:hypothetical protein